METRIIFPTAGISDASNVLCNILGFQYLKVEQSFFGETRLKLNNGATIYLERSNPKDKKALNMQLEIVVETVNEYNNILTALSFRGITPINYEYPVEARPYSEIKYGDIEIGIHCTDWWNEIYKPLV